MTDSTKKQQEESGVATDAGHPPQRKKHLSFSLVTVFFVGIVIVLVGELVCRFLVAPHHKFHWYYEETARNTIYRFDPELGWFPRESHGDWFEGSVRFWVQNNSEGFRDVEHDLSKKERRRLVVLGDSYVWGYDVEAEDRFTEILQKRIPEIEIFNCGVGGYGTCQERVLYDRKVRRYDPDAVLLVYSGNDRANNERAITQGGYARPHYRLKEGELVLTNVPLPKLTPYLPEEERNDYFLRCHLWDAIRYAISKIQIRLEGDPTEALVVAIGRDVTEDGSKFLLAIRADDTDLAAYCEKNGVEYIMVTEYLRQHEKPDLPNRFPTHGRHWTPEGHVLVADLLEPEIRKLFGITDTHPTEPAGR